MDESKSIDEIINQANQIESNGHLLRALHLLHYTVLKLRKKLNNSKKEEITPVKDALEFCQKSLETQDNKIKRHIQKGKISQIRINDGIRGQSYERLFANLMSDNVTEVLIHEPNLAEASHYKNLINFLEVLVKHCTNLKFIGLVTKQCSLHEAKQKAILEHLASDLEEGNIGFIYLFDEFLNIPKIILSNGIAIKSDCGLHLYKPTTVRYTLGLCDYNFRYCYAAKIEIWISKPFAQTHLSKCSLHRKSSTNKFGEFIRPLKSKTRVSSVTRVHGGSTNQNSKESFCSTSACSRKLDSVCCALKPKPNNDEKKYKNYWDQILRKSASFQREKNCEHNDNSSNVNTGKMHSISYINKIDSNSSSPFQNPNPINSANPLVASSVMPQANAAATTPTSPAQTPPSIYLGDTFSSSANLYDASPFDGTTSYGAAYNSSFPNNASPSSQQQQPPPMNQAYSTYNNYPSFYCSTETSNNNNQFVSEYMCQAHTDQWKSTGSTYPFEQTNMSAPGPWMEPCPTNLI